MTEKRYYVDVDEAIIDSKTKREYSTWDISGVEDIADRLNQYAEENEQLKTIIDQLRTDNTKQKKKLNTAMKENEQLKSLTEALKKSNTDYIHQIKKAYDEKLSIKELADNCGVDLK